MIHTFAAAARAKQGDGQVYTTAMQAELQQVACSFALGFQRAEVLPQLEAWDRAAVRAAHDPQARRRLLNAEMYDVDPVARRLLERGDAHGIAAHLSGTQAERCQELYDSLLRRAKQQAFTGHEPLQFRLEGGARVLPESGLAALRRCSGDAYFEVPHPVLDAAGARALYDYFRRQYWEAGLMERTANPCNAGSYNASLPFRSSGRGVGQVLAPGEPPAALREAVGLMAAVAAELAAGGFPQRLLVPQAVKLGCYPPGPARYRPHLDNYGEGGAAGRRQQGNRREVTVLLYPNPADWEAARDGGALRLLGEAGEAGEAGGAGAAEGACRTPCALAPAGGRCVVFLSRRVLHEVLPTRRLRFCLTLWLESVPEA